MSVWKGVPIDQEYVGMQLSHAVSAVDDKGDRHCYEKSAAFLIANGARLDMKDMWGESLLLMAITTVNPVGCARLLLKSGASQAAPHRREPLFFPLFPDMRRWFASCSNMVSAPRYASNWTPNTSHDSSR